MKVLSKKARFIKGFMQIKAGNYCKQYKLDLSNLNKGYSNVERENKVYNRIMKELLLLLANTIYDDELDVIECQTKN